MVIIVFGIPGVGKSTIIKKSNLKDWNIINFGDLMIKYIENEGLSRDDLVNLDLDTYNEIRKKANEELLKLLNEKTIIDTHASVFLRKYGILPGFSFDIIKKINPKILILIDAEPYEVYLRRVKDYNKRKRILNVDSIREELDIERRYTQIYSCMLGVPLKIINNKEGQINYSVEVFKEVLKNL